MTGMFVCLSAAVMGVDYGWQPVAGGGIEYIIQIEPELLDSLKSGHDIFSDLPTSVRNVRSYRITVGAGRLPHHGEPPPSSAVVPAGGPLKNGVRPVVTQEKTPEKSPTEIDLSQLPGPVLGPALVSGKSGVDAGDDEEPPDLADANAAEPITNRVAGYHAKEDQGNALDSSIDKTKLDAPFPGKTASDAGKSKHQRQSAKTTAKADDAGGRNAEKTDSESPPDRVAKASDATMAKPRLTQVGLFASIGCNAFLLWVATGQRSRYRALVRRIFDGAGNSAAVSLTSTRDADLPQWERLAAPDKQSAADPPASEGT